VRLSDAREANFPLTVASCQTETTVAGELARSSLLSIIFDDRNRGLKNLHLSVIKIDPIKCQHSVSLFLDA